MNAKGQSFDRRLRQGERVIEYQERTLERMLLQAASLVRFSVAALGGALAVIGLLVNAARPIDGPAAFGLAAAMAGLIGAAATSTLAASGVPFNRNLTVGPDPGRVAAYLAEQDPDEATFAEAVLLRLPDWFESNNVLLRSLGRRLSVSAMMLVASVVVLLAIGLYIAGGPILV